VAARNLLDPAFERTYGRDGDLLYSSVRRGRTVTVGLSASF